MTHYGLGGLCETHIDPYGYIEGAGLYESPEVQRLKQTGDIFGTLMGYLNHVEAGGATAFCEPFHEEIIRYATCGFSSVKFGHSEKVTKVWYNLPFLCYL